MRRDGHRDRPAAPLRRCQLFAPEGRRAYHRSALGLRFEQPGALCRVRRFQVARRREQLRRRRLGERRRAAQPLGLLLPGLGGRECRCGRGGSREELRRALGLTLPARKLGEAFGVREAPSLSGVASLSRSERAV
jgi:hypothetical protein